jgi:hypothetical protein
MRLKNPNKSTKSKKEGIVMPDNKQPASTDELVDILLSDDNVSKTTPKKIQFQKREE